MAKKQGAKELLSSLTKPKQTVSFVGIADSLDEDDGVVLFTRGDSCQNWVRIPVELIDSLEYLQDVRCGNHKHFLVRLKLHYPRSDEGKALVELAADPGPSLASAIPVRGRLEASRRVC